MTKKRLKKYRFFVKQIEILKRKISSQEGYCSDVVLGTSAYLAQRPVVIKGYADTSDMQATISVYEEERDVILEWVRSVEDDQTRRALEKRYIDPLPPGKTRREWSEIALSIGGSAESVRKMCDRCFE